MKCKFGKFLLKLLGVGLLLNVGLFCVFFFDLDGKGTLTLRGNQARRPVKVRASGDIRISGDTPFEK